jgi:DNA-binding transcriptional LysR family regulator
MDIRVLYTIVAIAEHGSFLAASRALNLSPAAVSLHVKIIEDELGQTLFDRSVRPPVLTDAGRRTLERAHRVLEAWEQLGENGTSEVADSLTLGALSNTVGGLLAPALARVRARQPQLRVRLTTDDAGEFEDRVTRGAIDAALVVQPGNAASGLRFTPARVETFHVVAPAGSGGTTDDEILRTLPYIRFRPPGWLAQPIEQELARRRLRLDAGMEIDGAADVVALVQAGLGASILPAGAITTRRPGRIRLIPFGEPPLSLTLGLLWRPEHPKATLVETLVESLLDVAAVSADEREHQRVDAGDAQRQDNQVAQVDAQHEPGGRDLEET